MRMRNAWHYVLACFDWLRFPRRRWMRRACETSKHVIAFREAARSGDSEVTTNTSRLIVATGSLALPMLFEVWRSDSDERVRTAAATAIEYTVVALKGRARAIEGWVQEMAAHPASNLDLVRVARVIGRMTRSAERVRPLLERLAEHPDPDVRDAAMAALRQLMGSQAAST